MFLGYATNHAGNVYRMLNPKTKKVLITRDVRWLNTTIDDDDEVEEVKETMLEIEKREVTHDNQVQDVQEAPEVQEAIEEERVEPRQRLLREIRSLQSYNNPGRLEIEGENNNFCFFIPETDDTEDDTPTTFQEAWNHKDPEKKEKWRAAIRLEYNQMLKNGVWKNRGQKKIPPNRKGIGTKWVFKEKKNGVF